MIDLLAMGKGFGKKQGKSNDQYYNHGGKQQWQEINLDLINGKNKNLGRWKGVKPRFIKDVFQGTYTNQKKS